MTHQSEPLTAPATNDAGQQVAQLRHVLGLVGQIAGRPDAEAGDAALDEGARVTSAYDSAMPIVQRQFDALAAETAAWAAAGVAALLAAGGDGIQPRAAAARLADELDVALMRLCGLLRA